MIRFRTLNNGLREFKEIPVSVQTYNGSILHNSEPLCFNLKLLYEKLPRYPYILYKKERSKKGACRLSYPLPPMGAIVSLRYMDQHRGPILKKITKWMRNQMSIHMSYEGRLVHVMIFKNGQLTITGCRSSAQALQVSKILVFHVNSSIKIAPFVVDEASQPIEVEAGPVEVRMINITYGIPFEVDRSSLNMVLNRLKTKTGDTPYMSLFDSENGAVHVSIAEKRLPKTKKNKFRYHTFLIYASGRITMSGPNYDYMMDHYDNFNSILLKYRGEIEETYLD